MSGAANGYETKDSGERAVFPTGSQRDSQDGKGRFDLLAVLPLFRLAAVYERGAVKYLERNWEKGQSYSRLFSSALRHLLQAMLGMKDEDHLAQCVWNLFCLMHFEMVGRTDLDDMPKYSPAVAEGLLGLFQMQAETVRTMREKQAAVPSQGKR